MTTTAACWKLVQSDSRASYATTVRGSERECTAFRKLYYLIFTNKTNFSKRLCGSVEIILPMYWKTPQNFIRIPTGAGWQQLKIDISSNLRESRLHLIQHDAYKRLALPTRSCLRRRAANRWKAHRARKALAVQPPASRSSSKNEFGIKAK